MAQVTTTICLCFLRKTLQPSAELTGSSRSQNALGRLKISRASLGLLRVLRTLSVSLLAVVWPLYTSVITVASFCSFLFLVEHFPTSSAIRARTATLALSLSLYICICIHTYYIHIHIQIRICLYVYMLYYLVVPYTMVRSCSVFYGTIIGNSRVALGTQMEHSKDRMKNC